MNKNITNLRRNIEIENAERQIELLGLYADATNVFRRAKLWINISPEIRLMLKKMPVADVVARIRMAIERDKFRPRDMSLYTFAASDDLNYVAGNFSTFDKELGHMVNDARPVMSIKKHMVRNMNNLKNVGAQYVADIMEIIAKNQKMYDILIRDGFNCPTSIYSIILNKMADELCKKNGVSWPKLHVKVIDNWFDAESIRPVLGRDESNKTQAIYFNNVIYLHDSCAYIIINRKNVAWGMLGKSGKTLFRKMIGAFAHEFAHFIDDIAPNKGALGEQKSGIDRMFYRCDGVSNRKYKLNSTEHSSFSIQRMISRALKQKGK